MSENEVIGGNRAGVLKGIVEGMATIDGQIAEIQRDQINATYKTLRKKGLPAAGLRAVVADQMKDAAVLKEKRTAKAQAGAMLGIETFTGKSPKISLASFSAEDQEFFQVKHRVILSDHAEIEDLKAQRDEIKTRAKADGFDPALIEQLLKIKKNPDKFYKRSNRLDVYVHAVGLTEQETTNNEQ